MLGSSNSLMSLSIVRSLTARGAFAADVDSVALLSRSTKSPSSIADESVEEVALFMIGSSDILRQGR